MGNITYKFFADHAIWFGVEASDLPDEARGLTKHRIKLENDRISFQVAMDKSWAKVIMRAHGGMVARFGPSDTQTLLSYFPSQQKLLTRASRVSIAADIESVAMIAITCAIHEGSQGEINDFLARLVYKGGYDERQRWGQRMSVLNANLKDALAVAESS